MLEDWVNRKIRGKKFLVHTLRHSGLGGRVFCGLWTRETSAIVRPSFLSHFLACTLFFPLRAGLW